MTAAMGRRQSEKVAGDSPLPSRPVHPFFCQVEAEPIVVINGDAYRLKPDQNGSRPHLRYHGKRLALGAEFALTDYDAFYFDDNEHYFQTVFRSQLQEEVLGLVIGQETGPVAAGTSMAKFLTQHVLPCLQAYNQGKQAPKWTKGQIETAFTADIVWKPGDSPLAGVLKQDCFVLESLVMPLTRLQGWRFKLATPDPAVYLAGGEIYRIEESQPSEIQGLLNQYHKEIDRRLDRAAKEQAPRYSVRLLQQQSDARLEIRFAELQAQSAQRRSEITLYTDPYHTLASNQGVFRLYRHVPAFVIRDAQSRECYRCDAARLYIALPAISGSQVFSQGCVRIDGSYTHPLVRSGIVQMDRCSNDISDLARNPRLCMALIKHLNDARMMLEIGFDKAPKPEFPRERRITEWEAKRLGLPLYNYRHSAPNSDDDED